MYNKQIGYLDTAELIQYGGYNKYEIRGTDLLTRIFLLDYLFWIEYQWLESCLSERGKRLNIDLASFLLGPNRMSVLALFRHWYLIHDAAKT